MNRTKYIKRVKIFLYIMMVISVIFFGLGFINSDIKQIILSSLTTLTLATILLMEGELH